MLLQLTSLNLLDHQIYQLVDMYMSCTEEVVKSKPLLTTLAYILLLPLLHSVWGFIVLR